MARTSGFGRSRDRRGTQALLKWGTRLLVVAVWLGVGIWSYTTGAWLARHEVTALQDKVASLTAQVADLQQEHLRQQSQLDQQRKAADALQQKYNADVPSGALSNVVTQAQHKIASGVTGDRLVEALRAAANVTPCSGRVVTRRLSTVTHGTSEVATFAEGLIQVSIKPASADSADKQITLTIAHAGSEPTVTTSNLPVRQSLVVENSEMQLNVTASPIPGYVTVALTTCSVS
jgi:hypothetical protein